jgi:hypothetical protein
MDNEKYTEMFTDGIDYVRNKVKNMNLNNVDMDDPEVKKLIFLFLIL